MAKILRTLRDPLGIRYQTSVPADVDSTIVKTAKFLARGTFASLTSWASFQMDSCFPNFFLGTPLYLIPSFLLSEEFILVARPLCKLLRVVAIG